MMLCGTSIRSFGGSPPETSLPTAFCFLPFRCINVFLQEDIDLPFKRWIDWSDISLTVDYSCLKRENIVDILRAIPETEIRQMQANIAKYRHGLQYSLTPQFDAVTFDRYVGGRQYLLAKTQAYSDILPPSAVCAGPLR
jgi:hypothetical protein